MVNKKGQGLSLGFIVAAAIAALVLVIIIAFTIGGLGGFFGRITETAGTDLEVAKSSCNVDCEKIILLRSNTDYTGSSYATKTYALDLNNDEQIDPVDDILNCWESPISVSCQKTYQSTTGETVVCEANDIESELDWCK